MDLKEFSAIEAFEGLKLTIQMWSRFFKVKDFVLLAYIASSFEERACFNIAIKLSCKECKETFK